MENNKFPIVEETFSSLIRDEIAEEFSISTGFHYQDKEPLMRYQTALLFSITQENPKLYLNLEQHPVEEEVYFKYCYFVYHSDEIILDEIERKNLTQRQENDIIKEREWKRQCYEFNDLSLEERWKRYNEM